MDRVLEHKQESLSCGCARSGPICFKRNSKWLLYDLTSTYFEGAMEENPRPKYGHSRDKRDGLFAAGDCAGDHQPMVFHCAYEVMDGNDQ